MITLIHIIVAVLSIGYAALLIIRPTMSFKPAYGLTGGTLMSGIAIMIQQPSTAAHVCISGVVFLSIVACMLATASYRKARNITV